MIKNERLIRATWQIMEQLLETENLSDALAGALETILDALNSEAGVIWLLDSKKGQLVPMIHHGPADISGLVVEYGSGIESRVIREGRSVIIEDAAADPSFESSIFDGGSFRTTTELCVPLNNLKENIGCVQILNKKDGSPYTEEELQICERMAALAAITISEKGLEVGDTEEKEVLVSLRDVVKEFNNDYCAGSGV